VLDNWGNGGGNFTRTIPFDKCFHLMTAAEVQAARDCGNLVEMGDKTGFALRGSGMDAAAVHALPDKTAEAEKGAAFEAMKDTLKAGVQVVSAPQLFPTPRELAGRMAETADLFAGEKVLEPSAGTGNLIEAVISQGIFKSDICAVEINKPLADSLQTNAGRVVCGDFLEQNGSLGKFDKIIMNPPFGNGADIQHILHARKFLNPGGLIVALCANGPRQREALQPIAASWEDLPAGSFKESGTGVNVALLTIKN
jgi:phospholipid N-methyltransferase